MNLALYNVDTEYCEYLSKSDSRVQFSSGEKATRPYVGIALVVNDFGYFVPLASPKPKHLNMRNSVDFLKIDDGRLGALNFNNMIPLSFAYLYPINMEINDNDTPAERAYKNLLKNQIAWCNSHKQQICKQADRLYHLIVTGKAPANLKRRCCDFELLERQAEMYYS